MAQFYRKKGDATVYQDEAMTQSILDEKQLRSLGGIPDWGEEAANTNIKTIEPTAPITAGELMGDQTYNNDLGTAESDYYKTLSNDYRTNITASAEQDTLKKFQAEIDALEAEKAAARQRLTGQYQQVGKSRQGTATAIQARRGLLGSDMGEQYRDELTTATNNEMNNAIATSDAEYANRRNTLMGIVRKSQSDEAKLRLEAAQNGAKAKIEEIKGRASRKAEKIASVIENALYSDTDLTAKENSKLLEELATGLGTTSKDLVAKYNKAQNEQAAKALNAMKDSYITLSEGQRLVNAKGEIVAEGTGKRISLGYGETLVDADGNPVYQTGDKPVSELDQAEQLAKIEKLYTEIEATNDPTDKALKQAQLDKILAETASINGGGSTKTTQAQAQAATFANRMEEANAILDNLQANWESLGTAKQIAASSVPNYLKSSEQQQIEQAQRNFINAVLRKESGAAIADSEFDNARKQYFPQPGDSAQVIANKKANRESALNGMKEMANAKDNTIVSGSSDLDSIFN